MKNSAISKEILRTVQKIAVATEETKITQSLIKSLDSELKVISRFFSISPFQSILFSFFINNALCENSTGMSSIIKNFGKDFEDLTEIHEALRDLEKKRLLVETTFEEGRRKSLNKEMGIPRRVLDSILVGKKTVFRTKVKNGFLSLLKEMEYYFELRAFDQISGMDLLDEVFFILKNNRKYPEVNWIYYQNILDKEEILIMIRVCLGHINGDEEVNFNAVLKDIYNDFSDRIALKRSVKAGKCALFEEGFLETCDSFFDTLDSVKLTELGASKLLSGSEAIFDTPFKPTMGILTQPENINSEPLFYNETEKSQIELLMKTFENDKYESLIQNLKDNNLPAGFSVLFYGAPGTGKTSTVKQIAKATGRAVFMIEIQNVQSKWLGDSEKNIAKIFSEYEKCRKSHKIDPILLFNEADAILGKRVDVKSSIDQILNSMENLLLQKLEDFEGIFIATTNFAGQLDKAFDRRLLYKVEFKKPDLEIRGKILQNSFENFSPTIIEKINKLYSLTGGQIANIKKKLLVERLLNPEKPMELILENLCKEELSLVKFNQSSPVGFFN